MGGREGCGVVSGVFGSFSGMVARRSAYLAAAHALRAAAACSLRCVCSSCFCVLAGSWALVGRGHAPRSLPRPRVALLLWVSCERGSVGGAKCSVSIHLIRVHCSPCVMLVPPTRLSEWLLQKLRGCPRCVVGWLPIGACRPFFL